MPYSLRFIGALFALAFVAAFVSGVAQFRQTQISNRLFAMPLAHGNAKAGEFAIKRYQCGACHSIPGVVGAEGVVGPPLSKLALRKTIDGRFPNNPDTLAKWLQQPKEMDPGGTMPDMGVTEKDARDMAAYLYTRR